MGRDRGSRPVQAKSLQDPISREKKLGMLVHNCHPSNCEVQNMIRGSRPACTKSKILFQNNHSKKGVANMRPSSNPNTRHLI
jgi:hypothetical protein